MLINQTIKRDGNKVFLRNTVDVSAEIEAAKALTEQGGGRFGDKNSECIMMGYIPPVMWNLDPWLIDAKKAKHEGDRKRYQDRIQKFFQLNPAFAVVTPKKYVQGCGL